MPKNWKGDPLRFFNIHSVAKHQKIERGIFLFPGENLTMPKKLKGGTLWDFPTSILSQNIKKMQGGPFEEKKFRKKCLAVPKKMKGDSLDLARHGMLRGKTGKTILVQVQFDTIIICRIFKNYFGQFVWIEKKSHYNSRVSLHEAPTKNQKKQK